MGIALKLTTEDNQEPRQVALVSQARQALAEAKSIDEVKDIRDKAEAMRLYLKQRDESLEAQNTAAEIKLWAERRAGELLKEMPRQQRGRPEKMLHDATFSEPTLSDLGIERTESHRWQTIASVPEEDFTQHIEETKATGKELTTNGVLKKAKEIKRQDSWSEPESPVLSPGPEEEENEPEKEPDEEGWEAGGADQSNATTEDEADDQEAFSLDASEDEDEDDPDKGADIWIKWWKSFNLFLQSLKRRGGIAGLTRNWSKARKRHAIIFLQKLADTSTQCVVELKESLR